MEKKQLLLRLFSQGKITAEEMLDLAMDVYATQPAPFFEMPIAYPNFQYIPEHQPYYTYPLIGTITDISQQ